MNEEDNARWLRQELFSLDWLRAYHPPSEAIPRDFQSRVLALLINLDRRVRELEDKRQ